MKGPKTLLYVFCLLFIVVSFVFVFNTDKLFDELGIQKTLNFLKTWSIVGLGLFVLLILIENISLRNRKREINKLKKENESLKAKIYDIEEKDRATDQSIKSFGDSLKHKS